MIKAYTLVILIDLGGHRFGAGAPLQANGDVSRKREAFELLSPNEGVAGVNDAALVAIRIGVGEVKVDDVCFLPGGRVHKTILRVATTNFMAVSARGGKRGELHSRSSYMDL